MSSTSVPARSVTPPIHQIKAALAPDSDELREDKAVRVTVTRENIETSPHLTPPTTLILECFGSCNLLETQGKGVTESRALLLWS